MAAFAFQSTGAARVITSLRLCNCTWRILTLYVLAEDSPFNVEAESTINVHARGLDARCPSLYQMHKATGIDFAVQAVLLTKSLTAEIMYEACRAIETHNLSSFTFVCAHATHRSCGCAVLLAILAYQNAQIILSTKRTKDAAIEGGMIAV